MEVEQLYLKTAYMGRRKPLEAAAGVGSGSTREKPITWTRYVGKSFGFSSIALKLAWIACRTHGVIDTKEI